MVSAAHAASAGSDPAAWLERQSAARNRICGACFTVVRRESAWGLVNTSQFALRIDGKRLWPPLSTSHPRRPYSHLNQNSATKKLTSPHAPSKSRLGTTAPKPTPSFMSARRALLVVV